MVNNIKMKTKNRNFQQFIAIALVMTMATMKRLLFSKKTIGLILLCMIPILVFSLWSVDAFPKDEELLFEQKWRNIPDLTVEPTNDSIEVEITDIELNISPPTENDIYYGSKLNVTGITTGKVDHIKIKIYFIVSEDPNFFPPYGLIEIINSSSNGSMIEPIDPENITFIPTSADDYLPLSSWKFEWINMLPSSLIGFVNSQLDNGYYDDQYSDYISQLDDITPRFGLYIQAFSDNVSSEQEWNYAYEEFYLHFIDDDFNAGIVGRDAEVRELEYDGYEIFVNVSLALFFYLIIPLITILYAISAIREDIENHTIVYLITRPISKTEILLYKFKGFFLSTWILIALSLFISFLIVVTSNIGYLGTFLLLMTLNVLVYGAIFFAFAIITSYPIVLSFLYVFFIENIISNQQNVINRFSVSYHLQTIGDHMLGRIANIGIYDPISATDSTIVLIAVCVITLILAIIIFRTRDFT
jgi:ABC-2 type transport system permease protein